LKATRERYSFGNLEEVGELPNLIAVQKDSFDYFMRHGLAEAFKASSPINHHSGKYSLELDFDYEDAEEDLHSEPKFKPEECIAKDLTYATDIFVKARFINHLTGEIKQQTVHIGEFPLMTPRGTFIIKGTERVVVSQLIRSPGVIFQAGERYRLRNIQKHQLVKGTVHPFRGEWLDFDIEQRPGREATAGARVARKRRMSVFTLLTAFGYGPENCPEFFDAFVGEFPFLEEQWEKEKQNELTSEASIMEVFKRARPTEPQTLDLGRAYMFGAFIRPETKRYDLSRVGRHKLNRKLGDEIERNQEKFGDILRRADSSRAWEKARKEMRKRIKSERDRTNAKQLPKEEFDLLVEEELVKSWQYGTTRGSDENPAHPHHLPDVRVVKPPKNWGALAPSEILAACTYLLNLAKGEEGYRLDDQDHFANRRIRTVGELIQNQVRIGLSRMERVVTERMSTQDAEAISPESLINTRPVAAAVKEFFATSQLSQFMDQVNPLSGLTHRRRLSALGPGGLTRERAGFEVRDIHFSHYGRMCPIETPEGPNIALIGALSTYGKVNEFGFIETPYRKVEDGKVVAGKIEYMPADEEEKYVIAQANAPLNPDGTFKNDRVLVRQSPQAASLEDLQAQLDQESFFGATTQISYLSPDEVQLMDLSPKQIVSVATALIPFLEHDDANRALMGANMQRQAVPLLVPEAPFIGTGLERYVARDAADIIFAEASGRVVNVEGDAISVKYNTKGTPTVNYPLSKFRRSNQNTCINQKPRVKKGDEVKRGQLLADGTSTDGGELALGKNLLVAFMPWQGYNFEDAIIISERLVRDDVLTSVHIHEHEVDARDTKIGAEEITRDIPNVPEDILHNLDDHGIVLEGAEVRPGDVLVGKVSPKAETDLTPEERLLRAIFGEKAREVRDSSLKLPHGEEGKVIYIQELKSGEDDELQPGVNQLVRVHVAERRKISVGDKLAGRHGNKGVIAAVLPVEDMPFLEDGTPVDVILNPLGVPSRMNVGQLLETHLGYAARWGWEEVDQHLGREHIDDNPFAQLDKKTCPANHPAVLVETPVFDSADWDEELADNRHPTIKQVLKTIRPDSLDGSQNGQRLIGPNGKAKLYDGRTGEPYDQPVTVGYMYIMKLAHLVDDKLHARSTGPYSMITQQPLGGKAQFGGQRFGEMEVWALEAYGAAYCLQELLTTKSDDVVGRVKIYEAIVKGENIPAPGVPESFKVLIKEMQALCLNVKLLSNTGEQIKIQELDEEAYRTIESLGINLSRPERGTEESDRRRHEFERRELVGGAAYGYGDI